MWDRITPLSEPEGLPVSIEEAKAHSRAIPDSDEDAVFERLIKTAAAKIEGPKGIGVTLLARQWQLSLPRFPRAIVLPLGLVTEVNAIAHVDPAGDQQTLDASNYHADLDGEPAVIEPAFGKSWPATLHRRGAVSVTFTAGYAGAAAIPEDLRSAVLMMVAHLFENREPVNIGNIVTVIPDTTMGIFEHYCVGSFGPCAHGHCAPSLPCRPRFRRPMVAVGSPSNGRTLRPWRRSSAPSAAAGASRPGA